MSFWSLRRLSCAVGGLIAAAFILSSTVSPAFSDQNSGGGHGFTGGEGGGPQSGGSDGPQSGGRYGQQSRGGYRFTGGDGGGSSRPCSPSY